MHFRDEHIQFAVTQTRIDLQHLQRIEVADDRRQNAPQCLDGIPANFLARAAGLIGPQRRDTGEINILPSYKDSSFEETLSVCRQLAIESNDEGYQVTNIRVIVYDILRHRHELEAEVAAGVRNPSVKIRPLNKDNPWGRTMIALATAFEVPYTEQPTAAK